MKEINIIDIIYFVSYFGIFPLSLAVIRFRYLNKSQLIFCCFLLVSFLTEVISGILIAYKQPTLLLLNLYTILDLGIALWFFNTLLKGFFRNGILYLSSTVILVLITILVFATIQKQSINNYAWSSEALAIIIYCLLYYFRVIKEMNIPVIEQHPTFWIVTGLFVYYAGVFFLFLFSDILNRISKTHMVNIWQINSLFFVAANILFIIGLWKTRKQAD